MNGVVQPDQTFEELDDSPRPREVVAREGSALAQVLRERGWRVRSGWRSQADGGEHVWMLRFEARDD